MIKRIIRICTAVLLLLLTACSEKEINFSSESITVSVGDSFDLDFFSSLNEKKQDEIRIEIDDGSLIDVDENGDLYAIKEGTAVASIIYKDEVYDTEEITILPVLCESIDCSDYIVGVGREEKAIAEFYPDNCSHKDFRLTSSDESICKVFGDSLRGVSEGQAIIKIVSADGPENEFVVNVVPVEAETITIKGISAKYIVGDEKTLSVEYSPQDVTHKNVSWSSSDETVLAVDDNGDVIAKSPGTVTVTARYSDEACSSKEVTVSYPPVSSVSLSANYSSIYVDDRLRMYVEISPSKVDDDSITWESSDAKIATVNSDGIVTAVAEGTVTIYARSTNGKTDSYKIEISKRPVQNVTRSSGSGSSSGGSAYCLNTNTKKFHRTSCGDIKKMKDSNKQYTDADRDTIIGWGYSPCKHCNP